MMKLKIIVRVEVEGDESEEIKNKTFEGEISDEESFTADLREAIRNGKDPIDAISFLADVGANEAVRRGYGTARKARIG
jgi:hypothetical protein